MLSARVQKATEQERNIKKEDAIIDIELISNFLTVHEIRPKVLTFSHCP
jgi:hypothetical protein